MSTQRITAALCGHRADGTPIPRRTFDIVRAPELFSEGKSRIWGKCAMSARHGLDRIAPIGIVWTDSIQAVAS